MKTDAIIELPSDLVRECRLSIMTELRQSDRVAAKEAYATYVRVISSPFVVLQGRVVKGTAAIQTFLNAVILVNRAFLPLAILFLFLGAFSASHYFIWSIATIGLWWLSVDQVQFRLNIELAARFKALQAHMISPHLAIQALVQTTRDAMHAIKTPRFFETERGYQGELLAEIRKRLPEIRGVSEDAVVEQEFQKRTATHGLRLRPDLVIHVPFDNERHSSRREGNYICFELKLRATEPQASEAYRNLAQLMRALNYPLGIFININSSQTYISSAPKESGQFFAFAVTLQGSDVKIHEEHT